MFRYVVHAFLQGVGEGLDDFGVGVYIALLGAEGGVGNIAGIFSKGSYYIAVAFGFKGGGVRFEFNGKIPLTPRKSRCRGAKINALVNGQICLGINIVFRKNKFKYHFGHTAGPAAKYGGAFDHIPTEIIYRCAGDKEISGTLCQLGKIDNIILGTSGISIDGGLASHKADIGFVGQDGSHGLVGAEPGHKGQLNAFLLKETFLNGNIHRRIKNRMGHLV